MRSNYFVLEKMKEVFKNEKRSFTVHFDSICLIEDTKTYLIDGWGFINESQAELDLNLEGNLLSNYKVLRISRPDVIRAYGLDEGKKYGFQLILINVHNIRNVKFRLASSDGKIYSYKVLDRKEFNHIIFKQFLKTYKNKTARIAFHQFWYMNSKKTMDQYYFWINQNEQYNLNEVKRSINKFKVMPKISIIVPVYNVEEKWLRRFIESVREQYYTNWELCIADDNSPSPHVKKVLNEYLDKDNRIKVVFRDSNGRISKATNSAIALATGDYLAFMDNDDELAPFALYENVRAINLNPSIDFLYSDEDKIDIFGRRFDPFFKPDWNQRYLYGCNYITHFVVVKRTLQEQIGLFDGELSGSQDYDFILRATERAKLIWHVPKILYHWRSVEGSTALNPESKLYAYTAGEKSITNALIRNGYIKAKAKKSQPIGTYRVSYNHDNHPHVSILFQEPMNQKILIRCVKSLIEKTVYCSYSIIIPEQFKNYFQEKEWSNTIKFIPHDESIGSLDYLNNAINYVRGGYIIFWDENLLPKEATWINDYLDEAQNNGNGIVSPEIDSIKGKVISAGLTFTKNNKFYSIHKGVEHGSLGYFFRLVLPMEAYGVPLSGVCMPRNLFEEIGEFDTSLREWEAAIDLCLRVRLSGRKVIWTPKVVIESSQLVKNNIGNKKYSSKLLEKWGKEKLIDPYFNPNIWEYFSEF